MIMLKALLVHQELPFENTRAWLDSEFLSLLRNTPKIRSLSAGTPSVSAGSCQLGSFLVLFSTLRLWNRWLRGHIFLKLIYLHLYSLISLSLESEANCPLLIKKISTLIIENTVLFGGLSGDFKALWLLLK